MSIEMPEGAVEVCRVEVVQYIHPDDQEGLWWNLYYSEDSPLTQIMGLIEIAKAEVISRAFKDDR